MHVVSRSWNTLFFLYALCCILLLLMLHCRAISTLLQSEIIIVINNGNHVNFLSLSFLRYITTYQLSVHSAIMFFLWCRLYCQSQDFLIIPFFVHPHILSSFVFLPKTKLGNWNPFHSTHYVDSGHEYFFVKLQKINRWETARMVRRYH